MRIDADAVITRQYNFKSDGSREFSDIPLKMGGALANATNEQQNQGKIIIESGKTPIVIPDRPATEIKSSSKP